jgi:hypothetical protein
MTPRRAAGWIGASITLLLVFATYLRPDVALTLAQQLWSCF